MKSFYEIRAKKFAEYLCRLFLYCSTLDDFVRVIEEYNLTHSRPIHYKHGVSRIAILRADYVVKFNLAPESHWCDMEGRCLAGDNDSEVEVYERAVEEGYSYLLAKTTVINLYGRSISIMPRIDHVGDEDRDWKRYVSLDEYRWLRDNVSDLHAFNVGYYHNKPVVIDYGWDARC